MSRFVRSFFLPAAVVAYVCLGAVRATGGALVAYAALAALPIILALVWRRTERPPRGEDRIEPAARTAVRACFWGLTLWLAARSAPAGRPAFDAVANLGAGTATVSALVSLARIGSLGGLLAPHPATRSFDAAAFAGLLWGIATAIPATVALLPARSVRFDPLAVDYATTTAAAGALLVLVVAALRLHQLRRLEVGVADRAAGALALTITAFVVVVPAAALNVAPPDRVLPIGLLAASLVCTWTATAREPTTIASALRGVLAIVILGAPTVLIAGVLARSFPEHAGAVVLASASLAVVVGLVARAVARPLGPEQSRWLDAVEAASRGALQPEPDAAIRAALEALSKATATANSRPELWRNAPEEVLSVDIAGYLHTEKTQAPERIYDLALQEPERTLRAEVLKALEVRRPEVRPLLEWFDSRRAFAATIVLDAEGPLGFLLLPRGGRVAPMTLEEARAIRILADRMSALIAVSSALARSREREIQAAAYAEELKFERSRLEAIIAASSGRHQASAERLARRVRHTAYSPAARMALEAAVAGGRSAGPVTLLAPPGCDPSSWAAVAHLASPRHTGPLVFVDGASGAEHDLTIWKDEVRSPVSLAVGGTLVLQDVAALPEEVQQTVVAQLSRHAAAAAQSSVCAPGVIVTVHAPVEVLREQHRLTPGLVRLLSEEHVEIPALVDRAEDLRALVLDALARTGMRSVGEPLGIDGSALQLLLEHTWPGNDVELSAVIARVARLGSHRVVTAADLTAAGFVPETNPAATTTPLPVVARKRPRTRSVRRH